MTGAHAVGVNVPSLNLTSLGVLLLTSGLASVFAYLAKSPLPPENDTTLVVKETTTKEMIAPTLAVETKVTETSTIKPADKSK